MAEGRFARVYYDDIHNNPKFDGIRNDRAVMGSWLFLVVEAEKSWPSPAFPLPTAWVPSRDFRLLVERGIIDLAPDGRFSLHGLDTERRRRSDRASNAATQRWADAGSNATGIASGNAGASRQEMPIARPRLGSDASLLSSSEGGPGGDDGRPDIEAYLAVRVRLPSPAQRKFMDDYCRSFDVTGPTRAAEIILRNPDDPIGALKADIAAFRRGRAEAAIQEERENPRRRREKGSGMTGVNQEMAKLMGGSLLIAAHNGGAHEGNPNPDCRYCREGAA